MTNWGMIIDVSKCTGCYNCFTACKDEYWDNDYPPYSSGQPKHGQFWMNIDTRERGAHPFVKVAHIPLPCMHCDDAPCIKAAKDGAVYKRPDGVVIIDPKKAVGQKQIVDACPYNVIYWNEEKQLPQKCTFCVHRLEAGEVPRCVQACPSGALIFGDMDDPKSEISQVMASGKTEVLNPELKTKPRVYYIGIPRMFIAGSAVFEDTDECAEGVTVTLTEQSSGKSMKTATNNYGEFEFDGLVSGKYVVQLGYNGYAGKKIDIELKTDNYLGAISLSR